MSSYSDKIKAKIKETDVEAQLSGLVDEGEKLVNDAVTRAGGIAHDKRADVESWLDKASGAINDKTEGKYADQVTKVRDTLLGGLDRLASKRATAETDNPPVDPREIHASGGAQATPDPKAPPVGDADAGASPPRDPQAPETPGS